MKGLREILQAPIQFQTETLHACTHWNRSWLPDDDGKGGMFCSLLYKAFKEIETSESAGDLSGLSALLAKLTISRLYDLQFSSLEARNQGTQQPDQILRRYWREPSVTKILNFSDVSIFESWTDQNLRNWAKILLDRREFVKSEILAEILLKKQHNLLKGQTVLKESVFRDLMLWGYTAEGCAQNIRSNERLSVAIKYLTNTVEGLISESKKITSENSPQVAEIFHCLGHLHIAAALHTTGQSPGFAINGIYYLGEAAKINNGYLSCYTSCHAELGDNRECLLASERILANNRLSELAADEQNIVRAEINFYMAIAHLNLSEFANARKHFGVFRSYMENTSFDAIRHAELFEAKTKLKSNRLTEMSSIELQKLVKDISSLEFTSQASTSIQEEKVSTENALIFLSSLLSDDGVSEKSVDVELLGDAKKFMKTLVLTDQDLVSSVCIRVFLSDSKKRKNLTEKLEARLDEYFKRNNITDRFRSIAIEPTERKSIGNSAKCFFTVSLGGSLDESDRISLDDFYKTGKNSFDYGNAVSWIVVITAYYLLVRFICRDRYVFALAPCENSPALTYQQPGYYLKDIVDVSQ